MCEDRNRKYFYKKNEKKFLKKILETGKMSKRTG